MLITVAHQLLRIGGVAWSAQRIPAAVNLSFQDRSRYLTSGGRSVGIVRLGTTSHGA
jgi:hypothetical protein